MIVMTMQDVVDGLSPRARGNPYQHTSMPASAGSIPACAGEPAQWPWPACGRAVYPRVRGGTSRPPARRTGRTGLSPRARGNPRARRRGLELAGSIPACAGEPRCGRTILWSPTVYPRVRGGTIGVSIQPTLTPGLSPRARGNRGAEERYSGRQRSIPACAGEPRDLAAARQRVGVYPRVRGGTKPFPCRVQDFSGLSPRARGNLGGRRCS